MLKSIYISRFFFISLAVVVLLFIGAFALPALFYVGQIMLVTVFVLLFLDLFIIFSVKKDAISAERTLPHRLDLGEEHEISITVNNETGQPLSITLYDTPPTEMQARDLVFQKRLKNNETEVFNYLFHPVNRGDFNWGDLHLFVQSFLGFVKRKIVIPQAQVESVYPSITQMKKFEFKVFNQQTQLQGIKKIRRLGHNNEFEQIKNYVQGDDMRTINWKASSRTNELMVNQYQSERSQAIYAIIDKSRTMQSNFEGMTLLDHAINSTLVFSNIALRKGDKVGVLTYADKIGSKLAADHRNIQLKRILELLYHQKTHFREANFNLLFKTIRTSIKSRSMILLFTNFETEVAMRRALPLLRKINSKHLLILVFFENTKLENIAIKAPENVRDLYVSTVAMDVINVKSRIAQELNRNGIQTILTKPQNLSIDTINKYLQLKSKGAL